MSSNDEEGPLKIAWQDIIEILIDFIIVMLIVGLMSLGNWLTSLLGLPERVHNIITLVDETAKIAILVLLALIFVLRFFKRFIVRLKGL